MPDANPLTLARAVLEIEARAIDALRERLDTAFVQACDIILACSGRVVVTGMGKSGHIGGKLAATLASTGTPAFFVHPGEASHGDLGMITQHDVVIVLSNSGETEELLRLLPLLRRMDIALISLTGNAASTLAHTADVHLDVGVSQEACPLGLAPTASTTAALAMGDALAVALLDARGFGIDDFARSHPAGSLGRRLLLRIADIMHQGDALPAVNQTATLRDALVEMTRKSLGMTAITDDDRRLLGVFTDGDLRRTLECNHFTPTTPITQRMTTAPITVGPTTLAVDALTLMQNNRIGSMPVVDAQRRLVGALNMQDMLRAKLI